MGVTSLVRHLQYLMLTGMMILIAGAWNAPAPLSAQRPSGTSGSPASAVHDFDFLIGRWTVKHRRLKHRLAHNQEWETFSGTCEARTLMGGQANVDDNVIELPAGTYRAATLRTFDPATKTWSIWWIDARNPHHLDTPVVGEFQNGVGTFFTNDVWNGRPIVVRFIWYEITPDSARWEQAFSDDAGKSWETNWIMQFTRAAP